MALSSARFSEFHFQNSLPFCCHSSLNLLLSSKKPPAKSLWRFNFCFWSSSLRIEERVGDNEGGIRCKSSSRSDASRPDFERKYPWDEFESSDRNSHSKSSKRFGSRSERERSRVHSAPWLNKWPRAPMNDGKRTEVVTEKKIREEDQAESRYFDGDKGRNAIQRIVDRLRNLGFSDEEGDDNASSVAIPWEEQDEEEGDLGDKELSYLLKRKWTRPDQFVDVDGDNDSEMLLPWERDQESEVDEKSLKKKRVKAPSLAELTLPDTELKRLRRMGIILRERITVPKAGVTQEVLEKIQEKWRKSEIVRLKFHEFLANDMKTAHEIVERRTGGLVIWRSGSVMVVYRGSNYEWPSRLQSLNGGSISTDLLHDGDKPFVPDVVPDDKSSVDNNNTSISSAEKIKTPVMNLDHVESLSPEEAEYNSILDGLGPRFADWWGTGFFPVDADLLPQKIPGYKTPFRLLPTGMRPRLTNAEMTSLRKLARYLPCHFALGRNRNHHGLAAAVVKLWERSTVVKIAVKRGIQNTNNKIMAEELKKLTGGILLLRNKYYIVIYRGKDFVPSVVASALAERQELTKDIQDVEEKARIGTVGAVTTGAVEVQAPAGTLAEFLEAQARWGTEIPAEENERMKEAAVRAKRARAVKRIEHKLVVAQAKKQRSERLLSKVEASMVPIEPSDDQETITDEERFMFRRVGLRMKAYLPLGIRGVFDGVIENMHLHWKHRELVKLISKQKTLEFVEDTARLLEYESGGILVAIERVPKGYALIYYRGKNYRRPPSLRPRNLLTKAKALKRSVEMQRHEALSQHITELEITIEKMRLELGDSANIGNGSSQNPEELLQFGHTSQLTESEDEDLYLESDDDTDNSDDDRVYSSEI